MRKFRLDGRLRWKDGLNADGGNEFIKGVMNLT